jgi:tRNA(Met) C34 N-acetyltransferase TmcA
VNGRTWKQFETEVARLLGGKRFWANSGEAIDVESAGYVAQCKLVRTCSLESLTQLAELVERQAALKAKAGVVAIKVRRGRGKSSPLLMVVTAATWERLNGPARGDDA